MLIVVSKYKWQIWSFQLHVPDKYYSFLCVNICKTDPDNSGFFSFYWRFRKICITKFYQFAKSHRKIVS